MKMQNGMKSKWKDWKNQQNIFTWLSQMELKAKYIHFILCLMKMRAFSSLSVEIQEVYGWMEKCKQNSK